MPEAATVLGFVDLFFTGAIYSLLFGGSSPKPKPSAVSLRFTRRLHEVDQILIIPLPPAVQEDRCSHNG